MIHWNCLHSYFDKYNGIVCPSFNCKAGIPLTTQKPKGRSPSGTLTISRTSASCGGYGPHSSFVLNYTFPDGMQAYYHETPLKDYSGTTRVAYLPDVQQGQNLLARFKWAWSQGLLFTIGASITSGKSGQIAWSRDVLQKSSMSGGAFGFPDVFYFEDLNARFDSLGVPSSAALGRSQLQQKPQSAAPAKSSSG